uniref:50S ribosomal protein L25 n=1 Tax=Noccaea caerulescens TaxID=107243 RepID=A0A1J3IIM4_NOCCA
MAKWWRGLRSAAEVADLPAYSFGRSIRCLHQYETIQAIPREVTGRRVSARDRTIGRIPAVVFPQSLLDTEASKRGVSRKQMLTTDRKQIKSILDSVGLPFFCSTTFKLQIRAGQGSSTLVESGRVLPLKIHRDESGKILNLVFVWADDGEQLKVDVPLVFKGLDHCPGLKKGGNLMSIRSSVKLVGPAQHIPSKIEVDVSKLDIEDKVLMQEVAFHPSLKLLSKNETAPVCKIVATTPMKEPEPVQA